MTIQPLTIQVAQRILDDLRERLARMRLPDEAEGTGWDYGTDVGYLKELADYWQHTFDWHAQGTRLNHFAQFRTQIDDVHIHFVHERARQVNRDLAVLCERVNLASPHLPDGRRLSFTISSTCCILAAQKKAKYRKSLIISPSTKVISRTRIAHTGNERHTGCGWKARLIAVLWVGGGERPVIIKYGLPPTATLQAICRRSRSSIAT